MMLYLTYWNRRWGEAYDSHFSHLISLQNAIVRIIAGVSQHSCGAPDLNIRNLKKLYLQTMSLFL